MIFLYRNMTHNLTIIVFKNTEIEHVTLLALSREQDVAATEKPMDFILIHITMANKV